MSVAFDLIPLPFLQVGQRALVAEVHGNQQDVHRLEEIGVKAGTPVEMVQSGSPCIVRIGGSKLCFRAAEMLQVLVRPHGDAA